MQKSIKPRSYWPCSARLKSCPFTRPFMQPVPATKTKTSRCGAPRWVGSLLVLEGFVGVRRGFGHGTRIGLDLLLQFLERGVELCIFAIVGCVGGIIDDHIG